MLLKWFAPILSFTTEEIFQIIKWKKFKYSFRNFSKIPSKWENKNYFKNGINLK